MSTLRARCRSAFSSLRCQSSPPCRRSMSAQTSYPIAASFAPSRQRVKGLSSGLAWLMNSAARASELLSAPVPISNSTRKRRYPRISGGLMTATSSHATVESMHVGFRAVQPARPCGLTRPTNSAIGDWLCGSGRGWPTNLHPKSQVPPTTRRACDACPPRIGLAGQAPALIAGIGGCSEAKRRRRQSR